MPKTLSNSVELGSPAPAFRLPDAQGETHGLDDFAAKPALLVAFWSNRCPFVLLIREQFAALAREYADKGLQIVAINSNDADARSEESVEGIGREVETQGFSFPYLKDASQDVAKSFGAACTPDLFLYDVERRLAYHGQFDDARPGNGQPVTGADLRAAIDAVLSGQNPTADQTPSIGCNIKWTTGNEPDWFSAAA